MNWWRSGNRILLKGVEDSPENPPLLKDEYIVDFLLMIPKAREDFQGAFNTLESEEQDRIMAILERNPKVLKYTHVDEKDFQDRVQKSWNTSGIYTTGPHGGGNF